MNENDHDLIIEMRADIKALREEVKEIKDDLRSRVSDHERRIRFVERWMWTAVGAIAMGEFVIALYLSTHK